MWKWFLFLVMVLSALTALSAVSKRESVDRATSTGTHDHGGNANHAHQHRHSGVLRHGHSHANLQNVTHDHSHAHGHNHLTVAEHDKRNLIEIGHAHGDTTITYLAELTVEDQVFQLSFLSASDGQYDKVYPDADKIIGEVFFELQPQGRIEFVRDGELFVAKLDDEVAGHGQTTFVVPEVNFEGHVFDLKIHLP